MSKKNWLAVAIMLIAAAALLTFWPLFTEEISLDKEKQQPARSAEGVLVGNALPEFQLVNLDGKAIKIGAPGKVTVINFWATWCPPCRAEMPELAAFASKHSGAVNFHAINIQESQETVAGYLKQNSLNMPVVLDLQGEVARKFRISAIPTTVVADKQGVIRFRKSGTVTSNELEGVIKGL